ncbi:MULTISPECIES: alpha/beta fold hydrolase [unclassified Polaribacter]|uniref:alpha/beta fold hydrolase n=1 Tax=unclassified Polaribacter TaxID=196858 RepID=UPI0011BF0F41|nr:MULTISPECIES: alpha/beta hydrolase [unclassified Polaribacter]TXD51813.1 alpha/beta hydrolase [Polaribacter sp. IC063]TXD59175.1 alpha/beta hydrolase [Polaribacter sp. IC066]
MQKSITFKNSNISFSDHGKGITVVLIHGFLENATMWKNMIPELSKKNRVVTVDILGHGKTACLGYVHSMELFAETIDAVLRHLKIRTYILVGHSLGGYIALALAQKKSTKIKGFCLLNATSNEDSEILKTRRIRAIKMAQNNFANLVRMSFMNLFEEQSKTVFKTEIDQALQEALQTPIQGYIAAQEGMRLRPNRNHILANNTFKKLIIVGKKDPVLNYRVSILEAEDTNSEIIILPGGHMSYIENSVQLISVLKSFIKNCKT